MSPADAFRQQVEKFWSKMDHKTEHTAAPISSDNMPKKTRRTEPKRKKKSRRKSHPVSQPTVSNNSSSSQIVRT
jgi:hypothetical protein